MRYEAGLRPIRLALLGLVLGMLPVHAAAAPLPDTTLVLRAPLQDAIGPASRSFLVRAIQRAEERHAACLVIELDTPGGLDESMRDIVKRILAADVPVVIWVGPGGARAASAGFFLLQAAHVAAMAPGTSTGAAHPVQIGGGGGGATVDSTMVKKIENDAASFVRSLAQKRGRNVEFAESAVRRSASISATEALAQNVVDRVAADLPDLLRQIDSLVVEVPSGSRRISTRGARVEVMAMGWRDRALSSIANPNVAYILLMLGTMGLAMELWNPGAVLPGVVGAIALLLAFFALQVLPVSQVGLLLLVVGVVLLVLEIKVTSYGALTLGGVTALTLGSLLLFESPRALIRVSWAVIVPVVVCTTCFFLFVVGKGLGAQRRRQVTGPQGMVGERGTADGDLSPEGRVFVHGEYWQARAETPVTAGERVEVVAVEGRRLVVRRCT